MATVYTVFQERIAAALQSLAASGSLPAGLDFAAVTVEPPRDPAHGDLATNAAMVLSRAAGLKPRDFAALLAAELAQDADIRSIDIAGPGFLNLWLAPGFWHNQLRDILAGGADYGRSDVGGGASINVEYVSANPTGPLHMGHCRGAVVGDALANLLGFAGFDVTREYYINDAGGQVDTLARSAHLRYQEALGRDIGEIPEGFYPGEYLIPIGKALADELGPVYLDAPEADWLDLFKRAASGGMMELIKTDLGKLGIHHAHFFSERSLHESGAISRAVDVLGRKGLIYTGILDAPKGELPDDWEPRPQLLFRATQFGDDVDRPLQKSGGEWTYFAADIAYHYDKSQRNFARMIDIWGADHGGYVKRMKAAVAALTDSATPLDVLLCQMVRLFRGGEPVRMSKRSGQFVTLADVVDEVGKDVVRFMMLTRRSDAQLDFDFAKVLEQSRDNPVFYVQYAHTRVHSALRKWQEVNPDSPAADAGLDHLDKLDEEEMSVVKLMCQWPRVVEASALSHEPHRIVFYLQELAAAFHGLWNRGNDDPSRRFVIADDIPVSLARLAMCRAVGQVIGNGLSLMGVEPLEEMA